MAILSQLVGGLSVGIGSRQKSVLPSSAHITARNSKLGTYLTQLFLERIEHITLGVKKANRISHTGDTIPSVLSLRDSDLNEDKISRTNVIFTVC